MSERPAVISGTVRDPGGEPVEWAAVSFTEGPVPLPDIAALTDERGGFALTAPVPGAYGIQVSAAGYPPAVRTVEVETAGEAIHLEIRLEP